MDQDVASERAALCWNRYRSEIRSDGLNPSGEINSHNHRERKESKREDKSNHSTSASLRLLKTAVLEMLTPTG